MDQFLSHELTLYDLFGRRLHFTPRELLRLVSLRTFIAYHMLTVAILVLVDLHGFTSAIGPALSSLVWSVCLIVFVLIYVGLIMLIVPARRFIGPVRVWLPVISVVTVALDTVLTEAHVSVYTGAMPPAAQLAREMPFNIVLTLLFEAAFYGFVMPVLRARMSMSEAGNEMLNIGGQTFRVSDLLFLESQEHYLHIYTQTGDHLLRARISDAVAQLSRADGIQPHRSFWVARSAVSAMVRENAGNRLQLVNDRSVPVARARTQAVKSWLARPDHGSSQILEQ